MCVEYINEDMELVDNISKSKAREEYKNFGVIINNGKQDQTEDEIYSGKKATEALNSILWTKNINSTKNHFPVNTIIKSTLCRKQINEQHCK